MIKISHFFANRMPVISLVLWLLFALKEKLPHKSIRNANNVGKMILEYAHTFTKVIEEMNHFLFPASSQPAYHNWSEQEIINHSKRNPEQKNKDNLFLQS